MINKTTFQIITENPKQIFISSSGGMFVRKSLYVIGFVSIGFILNSCSVGFVADEPVYTESVRPSQPSSTHIWIDGDWIWSSRTHSYARHDGYWSKPNQNRSFVPGHWEKSTRGNRWENGHWQRNRH